jgi:hypothetical protein
MGLISPNERDRWGEAEAQQVAWQWMTSELLALCNALTRYNEMCEPPFWNEFDLRNDDEWKAICSFLNQLFTFQYESYRLLNGELWKPSADLKQLIRLCFDWTRQEAMKFLTPSLYERIKDALELTESDDICDKIIEGADSRLGAFRFRKRAPDQFQEHDGIDVELSDTCRLDAFPEASQSDFRPVDESFVMDALHQVLARALNANAIYSPEARAVRGSRSTGVESTIGSAGSLILDARQERILEVLEGKALRAQTLADACGFEKNKLYQKRANGSQPLPELVEHGLVIKDRKVGFYRPDAPPQNVTQTGT